MAPLAADRSIGTKGSREAAWIAETEADHGTFEIMA